MSEKNIFLWKKGVCMSKKIALVLIMVLLINMTAWANTGEDEGEGAILAVILILAGIGLIALLVASMADANTEPPLDGHIGLVSLQDRPSESNKGFDSLLNVFQNVQVGYTKDQKTFLGYKLQF
jgi:hypothetical protein